ncbi:MAG: YbaN family protein [Bacteroidales bacterium]|nr:YbaN family protein [Bacteroidales bacterium]MBQ7017954.1 YbaN family protein [Bacteroidales bacterium]
MRKYVYIVTASLCVALGFLGMFLPVLPTTPFLLLAIWLFMRSSRKGIKVIMGNRLLAPYVHSYFSRNGIPVPRLRRILLTLWLTLLVAMALCRNNLYVVAVLVLVGIGVTIHLYCKREK